MSEEITKDPGWQYLRQSPEQLIKDSTKKFDSKKNVWIPDMEEGFLAVEIKSTKGDVVTVTWGAGKEKTVKKDEIQEMNPPKYEKTEDMANLTFLNDASVLNNLKQRYYVMMIYTYSGLFCVVINPYKRLPIYTESVCKMYIGKRRNEMPPHLFAVSDEAYRNMVNDHANQSMLITGESGAGKTENTKKVISYFAVVGASQNKGKPKVESARKDSSLEDQIVRTNPVLEAFGNAKTVRNNNSSRFGKFIRIHFNIAGKMAGGDIEHYLLEKSRVIKQAPGERCYHIFYQIMSEAVKGLCDKLFLSKSVRDYHFVSQAEITIDGVDDKEEMMMTDESFDIMSFTPQEKFDLYALTAAIMHMGEIKFKQRPREEQAECENQIEGEIACKLWKCDVEKFIGALLKPRVKIGGEWVSKGQNLDQVNWAVGALAKALYARMFKWLISRCNKTLDAQDFSRDFFIGVLDIAGFEIFDLNSFEQMWINFVNEKLQQFFNHHMFVLEQEEYKREGIQWTFIDFGLDLQATIDLIEKPLGIISCLDEECIVPKATDLTFAQKVMDQHLGKHPNLQKAKAPKGKQAEAHFAIVHYAGVVRYNVRVWLEKNKDPLNETVVSVLKSNTGMQLLSDIWEDYVTQEDVDAASGKGIKKKKGKAGSFMTVSMMYRESLNKLMNMLYQTHPHFIRCIIPNEKKQSGLIEASLVLNQLTCNGVLEGIRICRKGFPNRVIFKDFKQRYGILAPDASKSGKTHEESSKKILEAINKKGIIKPEEYQVGRTKVFFKAGILARLEEQRDEALSVIIFEFQKQLRWYLAKLEHKRRHETKYGPIIDKEAEERARREQEEKERREREERERKEREERARREREAREKREREERERKEKLINALNEQAKKFEDKLLVAEKGRKEGEETKEKLESEKTKYKNELEREKAALATSERKSAELMNHKKELERQVKEINDQLADLEDRHSLLTKQKAKNDQDNANLTKRTQDLEQMIKRLEDDKQERDQKIREYTDQMAQQDAVIGKLTKEKKAFEEQNRTLLETFNLEEEKARNLNKVKASLEHKLDEIEGSLEKERRLSQDVEKQKRKVEGELKVVLENIEELNRQKAEVDGILKRKESDHAALAHRLDDERNLVAKLQRQIKELLAKIAELEDELEKERQNRARMERSRNEKQQELIDTSERLEEAGGAAQIHADITRKRELELAKLRRELEEVRLNQENDVSGMKKKRKEVMDELNEQVNIIQEARSKAEKDKQKLGGENTDLQQSLDEAIKQRQNMERIRKQLEVRLSEMQAKEDHQNRQYQELLSFKNKFTSEHGDLTSKFSEANSRITEMNRLKQQLANQIEELRAQIDEEARQRQSLTAQVTSYQFEKQQLKDELDEEQENNSEMRRLISKANNEAQQWRARFESEGLNRSDDLEESRRKLQLRVQDLQDQIDQAHIKMTNFDKTRESLQRELTHMQSEADQANAHAISLEKKQNGFDKIVDEWKRKAEALSAELEASQREHRELRSESYRLKNALEGSHEQFESSRRENKTLSQELKDLQDQLGDGGKNAIELQKACRRLELENEETQQTFEGMDARIQGEQAKLMRALVEVSQIRSEIEKRLQEKEEEFENTRKNHRRALDYMNSSLENETRSKAELARHKKKMETDITELEIVLDQQNKMNLESQKNIKHYQENIQDLQQLIEDEQRNRSELRDQLAKAERRVQMLQNEKEELYRSYEQVDRALRQAENESASARSAIHEYTNSNSILTVTNKKIEQEIHALNAEIKDLTNNLKNSDERAKVASADASRFAEALHAEQEHAQDIEIKLKSYESQVRDMQVQLDEVENLNSAGFRKKITAFELKIKELHGLVDSEARRHQETGKNLRERDRIVKELQVRVEEDKVGAEKVYDLINKLQGKIKTYKKQVQEAEELAGTNMMKYRQLQHMLEDAETRADMAESTLAKMRLQGSRSGSAIRYANAPKSQSRSRSRNRGI